MDGLQSYPISFKNIGVLNQLYLSKNNTLLGGYPNSGVHKIFNSSCIIGEQYAKFRNIDSSLVHLGFGSKLIGAWCHCLCLMNQLVYHVTISFLVFGYMYVFVTSQLV